MCVTIYMGPVHTNSTTLHVHVHVHVYVHVYMGLSTLIHTIYGSVHTTCNSTI